MHEDPARGAVDGDEQVAARGLARHLRQVLDVDVDEARLRVLEGRFRRDRFALGLRDDILEARHAFALEQTCDTPCDCIDHRSMAAMYLLTTAVRNQMDEHVPSIL